MGYKGQSGVRNHAALICFFPPSPSGWGTCSCPVWLNATIPLSLSWVKLAQPCGQDDRMQSPLFATSRLGRVTMATARLLEIHGGYADVEDRSPPHPRERVWWLYWKLADRGLQRRKTWVSHFTRTYREWAVALTIHVREQVYLFHGGIVWYLIPFNHRRISLAICEARHIIPACE